MKQQKINEFLQQNRPATITFYGSREAELFSAQISQSLAGLLKNNYFYDEENAGFIQAAFGGQYWTGTMWPRDAGTILRELTMFGYYGHACLTSLKLIDLVEKNQDGYDSYPEYFELGKRKAGHELDGTCSIVIGMLLLIRRLRLIDSPLLRETSKELARFLTQSGSPVEYMLQRVKNGLAAGTGEFGGGCQTDGEWCNSVQNFLVYYTLLLAADVLSDNKVLAQACVQSAQRLRSDIETYLMDEELIWCVHPDTRKPDPAVLNHPFNRAASFVNGAGAMYADAFGLTPEKDSFWANDIFKNTFYRLLNASNRRKYFDQYGFYSQFEDYCSGTLTSASYGFGYALQLATIYDLPERDAMLSCLINMTNKPDGRYHLDRENSNWFYERYYVPEVWTDKTVRHDCQEGDDIAHQGCGALNVVNVAEPLKIARMIAGVDDSKDSVTLIPRLPKGYQGVRLNQWPAVENGRLITISADLKMS